MAQPTWNQKQFDKTFEEYLKHTSRTLTEATNAKAYFIARKAIWFTEKADKATIKSQLGRRVQAFIGTPTKTGKVRFSRQLMLTSGDQHKEAPLAALIINKRRGKLSEGGKGGLTGRAMMVAVRDMIAARDRSVAYIKSGWLASVRVLGGLVKRKAGAPPMDSAAKQIGRVKGSAIPAKDRQGLHIASIINEAWTKRDPGQSAFLKYGTRGLQRAYDDETRSMKQYIADKMKPDADEFNRKQR